MNGSDIKLLFNVIRSVLFGNQISEKSKSYITDINAIRKILTIAKEHDIAHIVAYGLLTYNQVDDIDNQLHILTYRAIYRYETLNHELIRIAEVLERNKIPFIPLKGAVIRQYYPEPWMRNSCDIDILVHKENLDVAISCLVKNLQYIEGERATHDVSLFSPSGIHVELHFDLVEEGRANNAIDVLRFVWDDVSLHENSKYWYEMSDALFYFYHIAHMAKHFETGGCGVRPFIDLWILDQMRDIDQVARDELLAKGGLLKFADVSRTLSQVWFGSGELDERSKQLQDFLLQGGVYGSVDNRVALQQTKNGGRLGYIVSRIFIPYAKLKRYYPILDRHPWLMPFMQIRRWFMLLRPDVAKMAKQEIISNRFLEKSKADEMNAFLGSIGL